MVGRRWCASWLVLAAACVPLPAARPPVLATPLDDQVVVARGNTGHPDLAVVARPSGPLLQLSLWIDAGSRDTDPPQLATVAAWLAAENAGRTVEAHVYPDATEFAAACPRAELGKCLSRLARALQMREVSPDALRRSIARLVGARRHSEAADPLRAADRLAFEALLGDSSHALFPLGAASDDADIEATGIANHWRQHFGPGRALLVAVGELTAEQLTPEVAPAFANLAAAEAPRARRPVPTLQSGVASDVADQAGMSVAVAAPDLAGARGAAHTLRSRLERAGVATQLRGNAFLLRGASVALLQLRADDPLAALRMVAQYVQTAQAEGAAPAPDRPGAPDMVTRSRRLGLRWAAGSSAGDPPPQPTIAIGAGLIVAGGRADRPASADPDKALRERWIKRAQAAWETGAASSEPRTTGDRNDAGASVSLDNGTHIALRRNAGEEVAIAIRFACGGRCDPPLQHGRAALLATLTTTACANLPSYELTARLRDLGAELEPRVDAESWGVLMTAPGARWREAIELAMECSLRPSLQRQPLASARLKLRRRLASQGDLAVLRARTAEALVPAMPGELAPWGHPRRQSSVSLAALRELWAAYRNGGAMAVSAVGPIDVDDALGRLARRLAALGSEKPSIDATVRTQPAPDAGPKPSEAVGSLGLAVWRAPANGTDGSGAVAFAALMRAALSQVPEMVPSWHAGGCFPAGGAWAAVALSGPAGPREAVVRQLREVTRKLPPGSIERAADQAFDLDQRIRASNAGTARAIAETLARARFADSGSQPGSEPSREDARTLGRKLADTEPNWHLMD
jgi:predicted Zn-dependent peptidase